MPSPTAPQFAARCRYLQVTMGPRAGSGLLNLCRHIIRDGRECVGPFLDDTETSCGIWELREEHHPVHAVMDHGR